MREGKRKLIEQRERERERVNESKRLEQKRGREKA